MIINSSNRIANSQCDIIIVVHGISLLAFKIKNAGMILFYCYLSEGLKWQSFPLLSGEQVHVVTDFLAQKFCNKELRMKVILKIPHYR